MGLINKSMHCAVEIQLIEATDKKPSRYQISISDNIKKIFSRPSSGDGLIGELEIVLPKFYEELGWAQPSSFDIYPVKQGWVAIPKK